MVTGANSPERFVKITAAAKRCILLAAGATIVADTQQWARNEPSALTVTARLHVAADLFVRRGQRANVLVLTRPIGSGRFNGRTYLEGSARGADVSVPGRDDAAAKIVQAFHLRSRTCHDD